jgi:PmbA protein
VSFLVDSLGKEIFPTHLSIAEDPHIKGAMGSSPFDEEGVRTQARDLVRDGVLRGYLLSTYTARKLGMTTTGNAGGSHNLELTSSLTRRKDDLPAMLRKMGTGLLVTELIGQGVNYLTGDYSRGAFGYWVKDGQIQHAVQEVTIAGNLKDMFRLDPVPIVFPVIEGSVTVCEYRTQEVVIACEATIVVVTFAEPPEPKACVPSMPIFREAFAFAQ